MIVVWNSRQLPSPCALVAEGGGTRVFGGTALLPFVACAGLSQMMLSRFMGATVPAGPGTLAAESGAGVRGDGVVGVSQMMPFLSGAAAFVLAVDPSFQTMGPEAGAGGLST